MIECELREKSSPHHPGSACPLYRDLENMIIRGEARLLITNAERERQIEPDLFTGRRNTSAAGRRDDDILPDKEKEKESGRICVCDVASESRVSDSHGTASLHSPFRRPLQSVRQSAELHARRRRLSFSLACPTKISPNLPPGSHSAEARCD